MVCGTLYRLCVCYLNKLKREAHYAVDYSNLEDQSITAVPYKGTHR